MVPSPHGIDLISIVRQCIAEMRQMIFPIFLHFFSPILRLHITFGVIYAVYIVHIHPTTQYVLRGWYS
jgi:hypothetical protein